MTRRQLVILTPSMGLANLCSAARGNARAATINEALHQVLGDVVYGHLKCACLDCTMYFDAEDIPGAIAVLMPAPEDAHQEAAAFPICDACGLRVDLIAAIWPDAEIVPEAICCHRIN